MNIVPLTRPLFERAVDLGVTLIQLAFEGGSDEGFLNVNFFKGDEDVYDDTLADLYKTINEWAYKVYPYSGAGDGTRYGDTIVYDLEAKKATHESWGMQIQYGEKSESPMNLD